MSLPVNLLDQSGSRCRHATTTFTFTSNTMGHIRIALLLLLIYLQAAVVFASWGGSDEVDNTVFGNSLARDWMSDSSSVSIQLEGCAWGYVADNEDAECMENGSQDGTTYWYQMANCRRAQAVFSVYGSSSGSTSCNKNNFKESVSWSPPSCKYILFLLILYLLTIH
jgi:hypothetical protein